MSWTVSFQVISGTFDNRPSDGRNQIWVGETVRFTLRPDPSLPDSYAMLQDAQRARNWAQLPQMTVTGTRSITVSANIREPLQIEYTFQYEGQKQLRFTGTPQQVVLPTATRSSRGASTTTLFPALDYDLALRVVPITPRGQDAASMAGAAGRGYQRGEREREQEQALYRDLERDQRQAEQFDRDRRRDTAEEERREALSGARGSRRGALRNGLLNFRLRTETELLRMSISQVEDYFRNLQAAIAAVTQPLDLVDRGFISLSFDWGYQDTWETQRLRDGRIRFLKKRRYSDPRPNQPGEERRISRSEVIHETSFPADAWVVAQVTGRSEKALFPVADLSTQLEAEQWARLFSSLISLAFFVAEAAVAPEAAVFELLLETVLPPEVLLAVAGASIVRGLVGGLRLIITQGLRGSARSAVRGLAPVADDVVGQGRRAVIPSSPPSPSPSPSAVGGTGSLAERGTLDRGGSGRRVPPDTSSEAEAATSRGTGTAARGLAQGARGVGAGTRTASQAIRSGSGVSRITRISELSDDLIEYWEAEIRELRASRGRARVADSRRRIENRIRRYQGCIERIRTRRRPTPWQSEAELQHLYQRYAGGSRGDVPFIHGRRTTRGTAGHTRPDSVTGSAMLEFKRYFLPDDGQVDTLITELQRQLGDRATHGPYDLRQQGIILDARGLRISEARLGAIAERVATEVGLPISNIEISIW